ncbi:MAG: hypothetical protein J3K34DRAFT_516911 [Monoraphidium minutum]|nr:MAG: hypothetical protein J3K34DRAFT_516911 [Monoraphidium minutum]
MMAQSSSSRHTAWAPKDDRFMRGGRSLLAAFRAPTPLERLLAATRAALGLLADALRSSADPQDAPMLTLGHHYVSCRDVGPEGVAPSGARPAGCQLRLQEICTFDPQEGPKRYAMPEHMERAGPLARLHWRLRPVAHARAKRLGRDLSVKIELSGPCTITLADANALAAAAAAAAAAAGGRFAGEGPIGGGAAGGGGGGVAGAEVYAVQLPPLLLLDPLSDECPVAYKGDLIVSCAQTGLTAALQIAKDHSVTGTLEQLPPAPPGRFPAASGAAGGGGGGGRQLGAFGGSWRSKVLVSCPSMGMQGVVFDCFERGGASNSPPRVLDAVNLRHLGPMGAPRLWAALHDAVLYSDPRAATGGKAAIKLAAALAAHLTGLTLGGAATRDAPAAAPGGEGARPPGGTGGGGGGPEDADIEAFDRLFEGGGGGGEDGGDPRAVPPCYKAQHALGRRLWYTLHYSLIASEAAPEPPGAPAGQPAGPAAGRAQ